MTGPEEPWYAVRCAFRWAPVAEVAGVRTYEERITLWRAGSFEEAIARAEVEAATYAQDMAGEYLGLAQAYHLALEGAVGDGDEIYSLLRDSALDPPSYIDRHLDTGSERQGDLEP